MTLSSLLYIVCLIVCVGAFYLLPQRFRYMWLLVCSICFFLYTMPGALLPMMIYVWIIFLLGRWKHPDKRIRKCILYSGVIISVIFLLVYKYMGFFSSIFMGENTPFILAAPMGIAYVTLQCISYLVDIAKKRSPAVKNPVWFFLFCFFFPKITAGPVESPDHFFLELKERRAFSWQNSLEAMGLICTGLAKKLVIADSLAPGIAAVFDQGAAASNGLAAVMAAVMYSFQIYYDFSGYTDIARGSALLFGINLTENFNVPYLAGTVNEFWRRWHISLSTWLKNYIYIPLGGSRRGMVRKLVNVVITFLVSGLWHGASWTFIFWGFLHGIYQIFEMIFHPVFVKLRNTLHIQEDGVIHRILGVTRTFIAVTIAWIFFRAGSMGAAWQVIRSFFYPWNGFANACEIVKLGLPLFILMVITAIFTAIYKWCTTQKKRHSTILVSAGCVIMIWFVCAAMLLAPESGLANTFIYFNF